LFGKIRQLFSRKNSNDYAESLEDLSPDDRISQRSVDTERPAFWLRDRLIIPPFDLNEYLEFYVTDSLAKALVDATTDIVVSPIQANTESDELDTYVANFNNEIAIDSVVWELVRDSLLFGFGLGEIVGNGKTLLDSTKIVGVKRIDPRFILIQKSNDGTGRFQFFRQRPGIASMGFSPLTFENRSSLPWSFDNELDPNTCIYIPNISPFSSFGHSLLQSLKARLKQRNHLIDAMVMAARNHANPIIHLHYQVDAEMPEDKSEVDKQRRSLREQVKLIDKGSRWLISAGRGTYKAEAIGFPSIPDYSNLLSALTTEIIVAAGLNPSSLGFVAAKGGAVTSYESSNEQALNALRTKQRNVVGRLSKKLYPLLSLIDSDCPAGEIKIRMEELTMESAKEKMESQSIAISNSAMLGKLGIISGQTAARELGYDEIADEEKWDAMTAPQLGTQNQDDPNASQQSRATINNAQPNKGNNPSGGT
jgi:hypothetical protein